MTAALSMLDEHGLPDLTMRRLAGRLGVQAGALYWHVPNKQTLLAAVADRIVDGADRLRQGPGARSAATALRDALLAYRDGAEVVSSTLALGLGQQAATRQLVRAMIADGIPPAAAEQAAEPLLLFIVGHAFHQQQRMFYDTLGATTLSAAATAGSAESFAFGLDMLLVGLTHLPRNSHPGHLHETAAATD